MKKALQYGLFAVAVGAIALFAACSGDSVTSTPVAPASADMTAMTDAARSNDYYKICHQNPDGDDYDPDYVVIAVDYKGLRKHCSNHSYDESTYATYGCSYCDLSSLAVGDDCESTCGL